MTPRRLASLAWLATVIAAAIFLAWHAHRGLPLDTDLMALLPRESRESAVQKAGDAVSRTLTRRMLVVVGHTSRTEARAAALSMSDSLDATGLIEPEAASDAQEMRKLGQLYFPHRAGLLSEEDRVLLGAGRGEDLAKRALGQAFGVGGAGAGLVARGDPFLLLPSFLMQLPSPMPRVAWDDGLLSLSEGGKTWVLLVRSLAREPFALDVQEKLTAAYSKTAAALKAVHPGVELHRTGAVFFAEAGARTAMAEAATLGALSLGGTILLILAVFRRLGPLLRNVLAGLVGAGAGLAACLALFGEVHVLTLLFGTSLLGVVVDYGLHYSSTEFDPDAGTPSERLLSIMPGLQLSLVATLIGYVALTFAPLHGLRQIAVFSVFGLAAAFATVVLWFPTLDRGRRTRAAGWVLRAARQPFDFWQAGRWHLLRLGLLCAGAAVALVGLARIETGDDVRRMQALAPDLVREQEAIFALTGGKAGSEFLLVESADDETALRRQEAIRPILADLRAQGALAGALLPADFVPSAERQRENRLLVEGELNPRLAAHYAALGLGGARPVQVPSDPVPLTLDQATRSGALDALRNLVLAPGVHIGLLQGLARPDLVRGALSHVPGVQLVEPTSEISALFAKYRERTVALLGVSAALMLIPFAFRYGSVGAIWVMLPPVSAIVLTPAILSLAGVPFNFFHAMALVLVLAIGVDYSVFCAESKDADRSTTMVAILLAATMTLLSFGLLASSKAPAISSFGSGMLIGITLAFVLAPLASRRRTTFAIRWRKAPKYGREEHGKRSLPWANVQ
jgi:predicted exporter